jgi:hypothetical protein
MTQDEPGGHRVGVVQALRNGRRALSTVAAADEWRMNPYERREDGSGRDALP